MNPVGNQRLKVGKNTKLTVPEAANQAIMQVIGRTVEMSQGLANGGTDSRRYGGGNELRFLGKENSRSILTNMSFSKVANRPVVIFVQYYD